MTSKYIEEKLEISDFKQVHQHDIGDIATKST